LGDGKLHTTLLSSFFPPFYVGSNQRHNYNHTSQVPQNIWYNQPINSI